MKSRIILVYNAYNQSEFIARSIASIAFYVDEIVVIDGNQTGPSTDSTRCKANEIIEILKDSQIILEDRKLTYFADKFNSEREKLSLLEEKILKPKDWVIYLYGSEVFKEEDIYELFSLMSNNDSGTCKAINLNIHRFYKDFDSYMLDNSISHVFRYKHDKKIMYPSPGIELYDYRHIGERDKVEQKVRNFLSIVLQDQLKTDDVVEMWMNKYDSSNKKIVNSHTEHPKLIQSLIEKTVE